MLLDDAIEAFTNELDDLGIPQESRERLWRSIDRYIDNHLGGTWDDDYEIVYTVRRGRPWFKVQQETYEYDDYMDVFTAPSLPTEFLEPPPEPTPDELYFRERFKEQSKKRNSQQKKVQSRLDRVVARAKKRKKKRKKIDVHFRLDPEVIERLNSVSKMTGITKTALVSTLVLEFLRRK